MESSTGGSRSGQRRIALRKSLGQHHLVHGELCQPLIEFLDPGGRLVVEIGPGGGVLTRQLTRAGARVMALEIDLAWGLDLARRSDAAGVSVIVGDALEVPWHRLPPGCLVAGNLPFNVGTAVIERLLKHWRNVPRAAFLVQKEVADRLLASPGDPAYGVLSLLAAARARLEFLGAVGRRSFRPPPRVDGAFIGLRLKSPPLPEEDMVDWETTVRAAFGQRRKQLRNALAARWGRSESERALAVAGIDPRRRAETLSLEDFLRLHRARQAAIPGVGDVVK